MSNSDPPNPDNDEKKTVICNESDEEPDSAPDPTPRSRVDPLFERPPSSRVFRIVRRVLLVLIAFAILLLGGVSVLSLVGGKDDSLKEGLEKFFRDYTGLRTTIGTLNDLQIYPILHMDIENVKAESLQEGASSALTARRLVVGMTFWDAVFSRGWIAASRIEEMKAPAGLLAPRALHIDSLAFEGEGIDARLAVRGAYNAVPFALSLAMQTRLSRHGPLYRIANPALMTLTLGAVTFRGKAVQPDDKKGMVFLDLAVSLGLDATPLAAGSGSLTRTPDGPQIDLNLRTLPEGPASSDLILRAALSSDGLPAGRLVLPVVRPADMTPTGAFGSLFVLTHDLMRPAETPKSPAPEPDGSTGTIAIAAGTPEGTGAVLPSPPDLTVKCLAGTLVLRADTAMFESLTAYGRNGESLTGTGSLSLTDGAARPGWSWSPLSSTSEDPLSRVRDLIPPSTPCANIPRAPTP